MIAPLVLAALLLAATPHHTSPPSSADSAAVTSSPSAAPMPEQEKPAVSSHAVAIDGREFRYTATAGFIPVLNDGGDAEARVFYVAYTAGTAKPDTRRPLLFFLNGGPGAASVWLHLGAAGPRRVRMLDDGRLPAPPYRLVDNDATWLDLGDLVFIDPVGTGYSRAVKGDQTQKFSTQQGDIDSLGRFIRLYLSRTGRWSSPLFLVGESYGAFRGAGLSDYLLEHGIALNGIVLVSPVLNFQTISFDTGNDLPYVLFLPSYAATAWYHRKLAPELQEDLDRTLSSAERWAESGYLTALGRGDRLTTAEREAAVAKLAAFTGLDRSFIDSRSLRIDSRVFVRELLRDRQQVVGYMDSRFTADNLDPSSPHGFDPTVATIRPPYTALINDYLRGELGFRSDLEYYTLGGGTGRWDYEVKNRYADTSDNLSTAMAKNPYMGVLVASGVFDLATPHASADYTLSHLGLTPGLRTNVTTRRYRAGHMMYLDHESRLLLKRDVAQFIADALKGHDRDGGGSGVPRR